MELCTTHPTKYFWEITPQFNIFFQKAQSPQYTTRWMDLCVSVMIKDASSDISSLDLHRLFLWLWKRVNFSTDILTTVKHNQWSVILFFKPPPAATSSVQVTCWCASHFYTNWKWPFLELFGWAVNCCKWILRQNVSHFTKGISKKSWFNARFNASTKRFQRHKAS